MSQRFRVVACVALVTDARRVQVLGSPVESSQGVRTHSRTAWKASPTQELRKLVRRRGGCKTSTSSDGGLSWDELATFVFVEDAQVEPALTLYRDVNGWCPYCEEVLIALRHKQIPYDEILIDLNHMPDWYREMAPEQLVPSIKLHDSGKVVTRSHFILDYLEEHFVGSQSVIQPWDQVAAALVDVVQPVLSSGGAYVKSLHYRDGNSSKEDRLRAKERFISALESLDKVLRKGSSSFLAGNRMTAADMHLIPTLERYRYQLPLQANITVYDSKWPGIKRWFDAIDANPAYSENIAGDELSWSLVLGRFSNSFRGGLDDAALKHIETSIEATIERAYVAAQSAGTPRKEIAFAVVRKLVEKHEDILRDACSEGQSLSQHKLPRLPATAARVVDHVMRNAAARLLGLRTTPVADIDAPIAARAARFLATRICAPRDMGRLLAVALRQAFFQEEAIAKAVMNQES